MIALLSPRVWLAATFAGLLLIIAGQQARVYGAKTTAAIARTELADYRAAVADTARTAQHAADALAAGRITQQLEASNAAKIRQNALLADRDGARTALDRLRVAIRATPARGHPVPGIPGAAGGVDGDPIGQSFAECAAQLVEVAGVADQAVTDVQTLKESWPAP